MTTNEDPLKAEKDVAYYAALVDAWVATRMEKDRALLTLAVAGIGLVVTLLTTVGPTSVAELALYGAAGLAFMIAAVTAILVFNQNSRHLEDVIRHGRTGDDRKLVMLDRILIWSFIAGVALTAGVAVSSGYARMQERNVMNDRDSQNTRTTDTSIQEQKSLTGIGNIAPGGTTPLTPSLTGIGTLKPSTDSSTTTQGTGAVSSGADQDAKK